MLRYAEYIEKAVELGIPDIIAHPDIYLSKKRNFGKIEKEVATRICQLAEKYQIPLEINLNNNNDYQTIMNNLHLTKQFTSEDLAMKAKITKAKANFNSKYFIIS